MVELFAAFDCQSSESVHEPSDRLSARSQLLLELELELFELPLGTEALAVLEVEVEHFVLKLLK